MAPGVLRHLLQLGQVLGAHPAPCHLVFLGLMFLLGAFSLGVVLWTGVDGKIRPVGVSGSLKKRYTSER